MNFSAILHAVVGGVVIWTLGNAIGLFALSRRRRPAERELADLSFVFLIPARDEATVIGATLQHVLAFPNARVVVVDDASTDGTADVVREVGEGRVLLVRRELPDAQTGKGDALNAGYAAILRDVEERGEDASGVVVCVLDADGRLSPGALYDARIAFADPAVGACQVSVRIRNRKASVWTRMQHFEFVAFTALYQRGRERMHAVGLGGNGQFARLEALQSLGQRPWSACLTEDQDLGIRLLLAGWSNRYLPTSWVSQQGVPGFGRLVRQRTRWFQGTLQCGAHLPRVAASNRLPLRTKIDLAGGLVSPVVMLLVSPAILAGWGWIAVQAATGASVEVGTLSSFLVTYALAFLPAVLLSYAFWLDEPDVTLPEAIGAGHLFVLYSYIWVIAGWWSVGRMLTRRVSWAKTVRVAEPQVAV